MQALFASCCALAALARKELSESAHSVAGHPEIGAHPKLMTQQFKIGDDSAYWSMDMTPPVLRMGWQTEQNANSKALNFKINPTNYRTNPRLEAAATLYTATSTRRPTAPSSTGQEVRTASPDISATPASFDTAWTPTDKKYQYWAVKLKPYFETQFVAQSRIFIQDVMQIDFTFDLESFKSYLWGDVALWYQYDSTNPENLYTANPTKTNYNNYFLCSDAGLTIKPILMSINFSIKLRNCYKTLIQSLTDWSNWTKIGPTTPYFGLLDYCKASDSESVTVFSWNPIASDKNQLFWGNTDNGNPQIDWDHSESGTATASSTQQYKFNYCKHLVGNEWELNNGGLNGIYYCAKSGTTWSIAITEALLDKSVAPAACTGV